MKEQTPRNELSERLQSLIKSKAMGVEGIDPLIEDCIKDIMERNGVTPEMVNKFRNKEWIQDELEFGKEEQGK